MSPRKNKVLYDGRMLSRRRVQQLKKKSRETCNNSNVPEPNTTNQNESVNYNTVNETDSDINLSTRNNTDPDLSDTDASIISENSVTSNHIEEVDSIEKKPKCETYRNFKSVVLKHRIPQKVTNDIMNAFRKKVPCLPRDARTLMGTGRNKVKILRKGSQCQEEFHYFGIEKCLRSFRKFYKTTGDCISLQVNIDGVPIFKSSKYHFWPILIRVFGYSKNIVMMVGLHGGKKKPEDSNEFMREFIDEMKNLTKNGIMLEKHYNVKLKNVLCDAPAKSFLLNIQGHVGLSGCPRCHIRGSRINYRTSFYIPPNNKKSKIALRSKNTYSGNSKLANVDSTFDVVNDFPFDPLHLVCLGVTKKILKIWTEGVKVNKSKMFKSRNAQVKLKKTLVDEITCNLKATAKHVPSDFQRRCRGLDELANWKGTEFRQLVLYSGPVVFSNIEKTKYEHFLRLHFAMRILSDRTSSSDNLKLAEKQIEIFVDEFAKIYGKDLISLNVHALTHICDDVRRHGCLDEFSCFVFESYLYQVKLSVTHGNRPLQQAVKRYEEKLKAAEETTESLTDDNFVDSYLLKADLANGTILMKNGDIVEIKEINETSNPGIFKARKFVTKRDLYLHPKPSSEFNIFIVGLLEESVTHYNIQDIELKYFKIPIPSKEGEFAVLPLLHC